MLRRDQFLRDEVGRDHHRRLASPLAAPGLEHEQLLVLNGELKILHVPIMALEARRNPAKRGVGLRHEASQLLDRLRRADAGDHILPLRIDEELAVELFLARRWVAREPDPGGRSVTRVAEDHHLHVDRRPDLVRDVVDAAVLLGARILPGPKHRIPRHPQLLSGVLRKRALGTRTDQRFVPAHHVAECGLIQLGVKPHAARVLDRLELGLERVLGDRQHDVTEHLDEATVAVEGEAAIRRTPLQPFHCPVIQTEVENGIHHAGHGELGARADGNEQRVVGRPERRTRSLLEPSNVSLHLEIDRCRDSTAKLVEEHAGGGRDRKPRRNRQPCVGHLGQPGPLAA